jgi:hypothetical protein
MKNNFRKNSLPFGEFIARACDVWGERKAGGVVQLVIKSRLIEFRGQQRFVVF